jgi:hypothetical protein
LRVLFLRRWVGAVVRFVHTSGRVSLFFLGARRRYLGGLGGFQLPAEHGVVGECCVGCGNFGDVGGRITFDPATIERSWGGDERAGRWPLRPLGFNRVFFLPHETALPRWLTIGGDCSRRSVDQFLGIARGRWSIVHWLCLFVRYDPGEFPAERDPSVEQQLSRRRGRAFCTNGGGALAPQPEGGRIIMAWVGRPPYEALGVSSPQELTVPGVISAFRGTRALRSGPSTRKPDGNKQTSPRWILQSANLFRGGGPPPPSGALPTAVRGPDPHTYTRERALMRAPGPSIGAREVWGHPCSPPLTT